MTKECDTPAPEQLQCSLTPWSHIFNTCSALLHTHMSCLLCKTPAHLWMKPDFQLHTQSPAEWPLKLFPGWEVLLLLPVPISQWDLCLSLGAEWILSSEKNTISTTTYMDFAKSIFNERKTESFSMENWDWMETHPVSIQKAISHTVSSTHTPPCTA